MLTLSQNLRRYSLVASKQNKFEPKPVFRIFIDCAPPGTRYQDIRVWGDIGGSEEESRNTCAWLVKQYSTAWYEPVPQPRPKWKSKRTKEISVAHDKKYNRRDN